MWVVEKEQACEMEGEELLPIPEWQAATGEGCPAMARVTNHARPRMTSQAMAMVTSHATPMMSSHAKARTNLAKAKATSLPPAAMT